MVLGRFSRAFGGIFRVFIFNAFLAMFLKCFSMFFRYFFASCFWCSGVIFSKCKPSRSTVFYDTLAMLTIFVVLQKCCKNASKFGWKNRAKINEKYYKFFYWFSFKNQSKNEGKRFWLLKSYKCATRRASGTAFWAPGSILGRFWGPFGVNFSTILATCFEKLGRFRQIGCSWGSRGAPGSIFIRFWVDFGSI